ncbi:SDR family oxidoreductase [Sphingobium sp. SA2]|uniref:SDR family oxidoreductase n=1 Tax=Sphingobium sp. SA2 TaxID=1524832 RepID=UPI0028C2DB92|nr:SDR family oxidoreductase [Sphingobium sp. SA2]MDT7532010.1 SDR family oxidoreductase [Sphingobium sp. SA2]
MILQDKKIVVIGGSSGIGQAVAARALAEGASVVIGGRSQEKLDAARRALGGKVTTIAFDAGDPEGAANAYGEIGPIDHFLSTAASLTYAPVTTISLADVDAMISSKIMGPLLAARFAAAQIRDGGSMTFFTGLAAYRPGPETVMVATVNAALEGMVKALAVELAPLRINRLSPGVTETPGWDFMPMADREALFAGLRTSLPTRRIGTPEDLAAAAILLMTNPFITGTVLDVDGGGRLS